MSKQLIEQVARQSAFIEQLEQTVLEFTAGNEKKVGEGACLPGPWDKGNMKVRSHFIVRMPEPLHMKLTWLSENMPNESMHSIAIKAVEDRVNDLLEKYYRPQE